MFDAWVLTSGYCQIHERGGRERCVLHGCSVHFSNFGFWHSKGEGGVSSLELVLACRGCADVSHTESDGSRDCGPSDLFVAVGGSRSVPLPTLSWTRHRGAALACFRLFRL